MARKLSPAKNLFQHSIRSHLIPFHPCLLYSIVDNVDAYSSFLPYCLRSKVLKTSRDRRYYDATLTVGFGDVNSESWSDVLYGGGRFLTETYISRVQRAQVDIVEWRRLLKKRTNNVPPSLLCGPSHFIHTDHEIEKRQTEMNLFLRKWKMRQEGIPFSCLKPIPSIHVLRADSVRSSHFKSLKSQWVLWPTFCEGGYDDYEQTYTLVDFDVEIDMGESCGPLIRAALGENTMRVVAEAQVDAFVKCCRLSQRSF
mmetsp:Transcript_36424/g.85152  ORF Transcript_36424/g.85152 Transcript_36424/m.85152 type:complete len:255 (-) Transcript_36424:45-809(-)